MEQRVIKVILPNKLKGSVLDLLEKQEKADYWIEESSSFNIIISILSDYGRTESMMDIFERKFGKEKGFRLLVFPVEASIPRVDEKQSVDEKVTKKKISRISREELHDDIIGSTKTTKVYIIFVILSTIVAAIGLLRDNVAVIIGAMVIAPFLGPNVALALSATLGDNKLRNDALKANGVGFSIVVALSLSMGYFFDIDPKIPEILSRTQAGLSDIILALASGAAGVLAFTTGASAVVIGVMVAVALLPPLTVTGLLVGSGEYTLAMGAFLLFLTNIICINIAGVATFLLQGVSPRTWWEAKKAKKATRKTMSIWIITLILLVVIILLWSKLEINA